MNEKESAPGTSAQSITGQIVGNFLNYHTNLQNKSDFPNFEEEKKPDPEDVVSVAYNLTREDETTRKRLHRVQNVNKMMAEESRKPPVNALCDLWYEKEVCCCFATPGVGKSSFSVQIGCYIAEKLKRKVLYFDYELTDEQFFSRYNNNGVSYVFPDGFSRVCIDTDQWVSGMTAEDIINDIELTAEEDGTNILIIDNITWLSDRLEKGEEAGPIMKMFSNMKKRGYSLLLIAHTPKREDLRPLSLNDLAGSRKIANFIDSCFALNWCADGKRRYLKQLKARIGEIKYGAENVCVYAVEQNPDNNMLSFVFQGYSTEKECLPGDSIPTIKKPTREQAIKCVFEYYPDANRNQFAKAIGVDSSYIYRLCPRSHTQTDVPF